MSITQLKTCCCGVFSLRTGSLIILWINLIVGLILAFVPSRIDLSASRRSVNDDGSNKQFVMKNDHKKVTTTPPTVIDWEDLSHEYSFNYKAVEVFHTWSPPAGWAITVTSLSGLYGVTKEKPMFIMPFIISSLFITILLAVIEVAVTSKKYFFCTIAYLILHSEIFLYFVFVVMSYYRLTAGYVLSI